MVSSRERRLLLITVPVVFVGVVLTILGAEWFFAGMAYGVIATTVLAAWFLSGDSALAAGRDGGQ